MFPEFSPKQSIRTEMTRPFGWQMLASCSHLACRIWTCSSAVSLRHPHNLGIEKSWESRSFRLGADSLQKSCLIAEFCFFLELLGSAAFHYQQRTEQILQDARWTELSVICVRRRREPSPKKRPAGGLEVAIEWPWVEMDPMDLLLQHVIASHDVNLYQFIICFGGPFVWHDVAVFRLCLFIASTTGHESVVAPMASLSFSKSHPKGRWKSEKVGKTGGETLGFAVKDVKDVKDDGLFIADGGVFFAVTLCPGSPSRRASRQISASQDRKIVKNLENHQPYWIHYNTLNTIGQVNILYIHYIYTIYI